MCIRDSVDLVHLAHCGQRINVVFHSRILSSNSYRLPAVFWQQCNCIEINNGIDGCSRVIWGSTNRGGNFNWLPSVENHRTYHIFGWLCTTNWHYLRLTNKPYLWVVEECLTVIGTATSTKWLHPRTVELGVMPTLLETEDWRVDLVTDRQVFEVLAEVNKTHPDPTHTELWLLCVSIMQNAVISATFIFTPSKNRN